MVFSLINTTEEQANRTAEQTPVNSKPPVLQHELL